MPGPVRDLLGPAPGRRRLAGPFARGRGLRPDPCRGGARARVRERAPGRAPPRRARPRHPAPGGDRPLPPRPEEGAVRRRRRRPPDALHRQHRAGRRRRVRLHLGRGAGLALRHRGLPGHAQHPERRVHHPRRGAEHHRRADEDVPHPPRLRQQDRRHGRRHAGRPAGRSGQRPARRAADPRGRRGRPLQRARGVRRRAAPAGRAHRRGVRAVRRRGRVAAGARSARRAAATTPSASCDRPPVLGGRPRPAARRRAADLAGAVRRRRRRPRGAGRCGPARSGRPRSAARRPPPTCPTGSAASPRRFTAVLVHQLRDAGLLDLDDRLEQHLPGTRHGAVTLRRMLAHLSGLQREPVGDLWVDLLVPTPRGAAGGLRAGRAGAARSGRRTTTRTSPTPSSARSSPAAPAAPGSRRCRSGCSTRSA